MKFKLQNLLGHSNFSFFEVIASHHMNGFWIKSINNDGFVLFPGYWEKLNLNRNANETNFEEWLESLTAESQQLLQKPQSLFKGESKSVHVSTKHVAKNGAILTFQCTLSKINDPETGEPYLIASFIDISENEKQSNSLIACNRAGRIGYWEVDFIENTVFWSDMTREIHEVPDDYIPNLTEGINFYKEGYSRNSIQKEITKALENESGYSLDLQLVTAKGNEVWVRAIGQTEHRDGQCIRMYGTFQDIDKQTKAAQLLALEKEKLNGIIESSNLGTWEWHVNTGKTIFSERWASMLGYSIEELQPISFETWEALLHPDDLEKTKLQLTKVFNREAQSYQADFRMLHKSGDWKWIHASGNVYQWSADGKPLIVFGTHFDNSEAKQIEKELTHNAAVFKGSFEKAGTGMAFVSTEGKWMKINERACQIFGYEESVLLNKTFQELTHPEDLEKDLTLLQETILGKRDGYNLSKRYFHKSGHIIHALLFVTAIRDHNGKIDHFLSQIIDITKQKELEEGLRVLNEKNQAILDASEHVSIISTDTKGVIKTFNKGAEKLLGYSANEVVNLKSPALFHKAFEVVNRGKELTGKYGEKVEGFEVFSTIAIKEGEKTFEWTYVSKEGIEFPVLLSLSTIGSKNNPEGFLGVATNISQQKKIQQELSLVAEVVKTQNERLKNFAHIVSHNLRSHSGNIAQLLHYLEVEKPELAENEMMNMLSSASTSLSETIGHLANVAVYMTDDKNDVEPISLKESLEKSIDSIQGLAKNANLSISLNIEKVIVFKGIPAYIDSVFTNFMTNAIKYRSEERDSTLIITSKEEDGYVCIAFEDNGLGIDLSKHADKLFGMYKTFHNHPDSRGLGLFITKNQVEAMGGYITVESEVNKGTTFKVFLKHD